MLFNSFAFLLFFPLVCLIYFILPFRYRNIFLLIASYYFYMNWEPIYALLILLSTLITWGCGILIDKIAKNETRKIVLVVSLVLNLSILFLFKYANFISESVYDLLSFWNIKIDIPKFTLLLPVGISFYTFQAIGYTIDVYRKTIKAEKNIFVYALFVSFFPQLVAGPIERAKNLLPQFYQKHNFDPSRVTEGLRLMLWGYFMKVVVADRVSIFVDAVYNNANHHSSISLMIATFLFAFQIYCDFGGYSNIAIGCAKILGFDLMTNFRRPYLAMSVASFWRRWHISLSTWFRDYVYIPLGGNRCGKWRKYYNLMVTFLISGVWHGANWTFIIWGGLNGIYQIAGDMIDSATGNRFSNPTKKIVKAYHVLMTFALISFSWIFFRANSTRDAFIVIKRIIYERGPLSLNDKHLLMYCFAAVIFLIISDILQERNNEVHYFLNNKITIVRWLSYIFLILWILIAGVFDSSQFIYFQF